MLISLTDEVAVVTGAANGIGRGIALGMLEAGAAVALLDRDEAALEEVVAAGGSFAGPVSKYVVDVSDPVAVSQAVEDSGEVLGDPTILVTAAGIDQSRHIEEITPAEWQTMLNVNLSGSFYCLQAVLPAMKRRGRGRVVLFGSNLGLKGGPDLAHYGAAKAGVHGLARCAAIDLAPFNITVNTVAPGPVETDMLWSLPADWLAAKRAELLVGRFGTVSDIVPTVILLVSGAGAFYTGSTINISGGDVMQ